MPPRSAPPTWRLLELLPPSTTRCPACGQVHRYLMMRTRVGDCMPALFPPGMSAPLNIGTEVELHLVAPADPPTAAPERSRYQQVAERVREASIRCEGCGERFEELGEYRVHACEVRYR